MRYNNRYRESSKEKNTTLWLPLQQLKAKLILTAKVVKLASEIQTLTTAQISALPPCCLQQRRHFHWDPPQSAPD